jgi:hypothetical protein
VPPTPAGVVHGVAGFAALAALMGGMVALSVAFGRDPRWSRLRGPSLTLALVAPALFVAGLALPSPPVRAWASGGWIGAVAWRGFLACLAAWLLMVAAHLRRPERAPLASTAPSRRRDAGSATP